MSTTVGVTETIPKILGAVYTSGGFPTPNRNGDKYRLYQCKTYDTGMACKKIDNPNFQIDDNIQILSVNKWIPEIFDYYVLKYKYYSSLKTKDNK